LCMCSDSKDLNLLRFSGSILAISRFCFKIVQNCFCSRSLNKFATSLPTCNKSHRRCCRWQRLPKWNTKTLQHLKAGKLTSLSDSGMRGTSWWATKGLLSWPRPLPRTGVSWDCASKWRILLRSL
jgi:hypothetical protein